MPHNKERHTRFDLHTLLQASHLLSKSQDINFILNNLLLITMGKLMIGRGLVLLYEPDDNRYKVVKSKGNASMPQGDTLYFEPFKPIMDQAVVSCSDDELGLPELISGDANCTLFNLQTSDKHLGFLCLGSKMEEQPLNQQETDFVKGLAAVASVSISNARTIDALKQANRRLDRKNYELNTLFDLSKDFNKRIEREEIIRIFKFAMLGQMLIHNFFFLLHQDGQKELAAVNNASGKLEYKEIEALFSVSADIHIVGDDLKAEIPFLRENKIHALLPLYFQDQKLAVVGVGRRANGKAYSEADFKFLQSLGNLALLSIQKTVLLEERIEKERLEEELNIATNIQQGLLPHPLPSYPQLDMAATNVSSQQVGGDYFDIVETPKGNILFAIGDVTGKGTPAALLMANLQAIIHVLLPFDISLDKATRRLNQMLYQNTPPDKFVTFFWGVLDRQKSQLTYVNAGHNPTLLFRKGKTACAELSDGGLILGAMPTATAGTYVKNEVELNDGDLLVFYTDGLTEALNRPQTEEYGKDRLIKCVQRHREKSSQAILNAVITDINQWTGDIQYDDITLMVVKMTNE